MDPLVSISNPIIVDSSSGFQPFRAGPLRKIRIVFYQESAKWKTSSKLEHFD